MAQQICDDSHERALFAWPSTVRSTRAELPRSGLVQWIFSYYAGREGAPRNARNESIWRRRVVAAAKKGAARNDDECLFILGILYANGHGMKKDWRRATQLYRRAAKLGNAAAAACLGYCYRDGEGVRPDRRAARAWFERAARLGSLDAPRELARLAKSA